ncbi:MULTISPECIES: RNA polymerase sigma-70 factor [Niastella]|uniref:RNA polymerase sigma-70 factor n=1 Tax=Niastella soli TaxID=2821487 RepID=A0ABS3Z004_9BACT|nr:RNA polymerase sigma-70 factor [Niastella soli]MBO9202990.1 RNA polymerase sigma-70 factor [Niastella soli]
MDSSALHNDREIFKRIARGDAQAFAEFYDAYAVKLALYVSRFLGSELWAEEIVHDTFLKLWSIRETLTTVETPAAFVYRMIANRAKDHLKHQEHEVKLQQHLVRHLQHANTTQDLLDYQRGEKLYRLAIQQLPAQRALVFKMRHEQGMSYDEIARELELSRHTVRNLLNLALKDIRHYLLQHGDIAGAVALICFLK